MQQQLTLVVGPFVGVREGFCVGEAEDGLRDGPLVGEVEGLRVGAVGDEVGPFDGAEVPDSTRRAVLSNQSKLCFNPQMLLSFKNSESKLVKKSCALPGTT